MRSVFRVKFASYKKDSAKVDVGTKLDAPDASDAVKTVNPQKVAFPGPRRE